MSVRSQDLQRTLRKAHVEGLTGYISVSFYEQNSVRYGTLHVKGGQLLKAKCLGATGRSAVNAMSKRKFETISFTPSLLRDERDPDIPLIDKVLEGELLDTRDESIAATQFDARTLEDDARELITKLYGDAGQRRLRQICAKFPPANNPSLFIDMCEELLEPLFGEARAQQLMRPLYQRARQ